MFSATKSSAGPYPLANSRKKFVQELNANEHKLFNRSFDTATKFLNRTGKLKQTKLCLNKSWTTKRTENDYGNNASYKTSNENATFDVMRKEITATKLFFQLPTKVQNLNKTLAKLPTATHGEAVNTENKLETVKNTLNVLDKNGRNCLVIIGRVDFCLKMHKKHPEVNPIWDVYGQLFKKTQGKQRCEFIIILRNDTGGPVLQGIYYDFSNKLACINIGCHLRIVGRFIGDNRLQTFKLQQMADTLKDEHFNRIQNVTSFALLQNEI